MKKIYKLKDKFIKSNNGSAILTSMLVLILVSIVIFSISNIYINKMNSIRNISDYYDNKIKEEINKNKIKENKD